MKNDALRKQLILIGLNQFNTDLLREASEIFDLKNIQKLLSMHKTKTTTNDTTTDNLLEPWVQWVSIQTGVPSSEHKIKHLGDIPRVEVPQLWETLSDLGVTSGVWGALNANRGKALNCLFFVPDPWTFSEDGHPEELDRLLDLPRYLAKNYLNISKSKVLEKTTKLVAILSQCKAGVKIAREIPRFLKDILVFRGSHFVFVAFTDFILTQLFVEYRKKYQPQFSMIYLNSVSHLQSRHWRGDLSENQKLRTGLEYLDMTLGVVLADVGENETCLIANGLSQKNTNGETPWIIYRQRDQMTFLEKMGLNPLRVESHMTHDAHIFFETLEDCMKAEEILKGATIRGQNFFEVESYKDEPLKLFYRIDFTSEVFPHEEFCLGGKDHKFSKYFEALVTRTAKSTPRGTLFSNDPSFPNDIANHQIADYILGYFLPDEVEKEATNALAAPQDDSAQLTMW